MKITKQQLEQRIGGYVSIRKVGINSQQKGRSQLEAVSHKNLPSETPRPADDYICPLSSECYMSGEVNNCINGDYQNCDLYEKMLKGGEL